MVLEGNTDLVMEFPKDFRSIIYFECCPNYVFLDSSRGFRVGFDCLAKMTNRGRFSWCLIYVRRENLALATGARGGSTRIVQHSLGIRISLDFLNSGQRSCSMTEMSKSFVPFY